MIGIGVATLAFIGAAVIVAREIWATTPSGDGASSRDLLEDGTGDRLIVRASVGFLAAVIVGYLAFDRAFAWLHIPGTPLFLGEFVMFAALGLLLVSPIAGFGAVLRRNRPALILLTWMAWGAVFLVLQGPSYGIDALRDSAQWYYASFSFVVLFILAKGYVSVDGVRRFLSRIAPYVIVWMPISILLNTLFGQLPIYVPDSLISVFARRPGNAAVVSMAFVGYIWMVEDERSMSERMRLILTTTGILTVLLAGIVNRGGLVSGAVGLILVLVLIGRSRGTVVLTVSAVVLSTLTLALITDLEVDIFENGRVISARQLLGNLSSVTEVGNEDGFEQGTVEWRLNLWERVVDDVTKLHPVSGFGPGPDLGERYEVTTNPDIPLRNPHNSHLGVLARMGLVGAGLWIAFWVSWYTSALTARRRAIAGGAVSDAALLAWMTAVATMILVNAIFDPTLEGPQVAIPLWSGVGVVLYLIGRRLPSAESEPASSAEISLSLHPLERT